METPRRTERQSVIITAYTGILCGDFSSFHNYVEEILQRPFFSHELANVEIFEEIKEASKSEFMGIVYKI